VADEPPNRLDYEARPPATELPRFRRIVPAILIIIALAIVAFSYAGAPNRDAMMDNAILAIPFLVLAFFIRYGNPRVW
jgi:peptidoglycan/LPS O-acetylase OafA/YrhL